MSLITTVAQLDAEVLAEDVNTTLVKAQVGSSGPAGCFFSMWQATGSPGAGATPTTAAVCNGSTAGCFPFQLPVTQSNLALVEMVSSNFQPTPAIIADRIIQMGGLSGTSNTAQTVNTPTLPTDRGIDANNYMLWWMLEWYGNTGSTGVTATISGTNTAGTSGILNTLAIPANMKQGNMLLLVNSTGDFYRSIETVTLSASTGTAGNFGVTCIVPKAIISMSDYTNRPFANNWSALGLPRIYDNSCLFLILRQESSATIAGKIVLAQS